MKKYFVSKGSLLAQEPSLPVTPGEPSVVWIDACLSEYEAIEKSLANDYQLTLNEVHRTEIQHNGGQVYFDTTPQYDVLILVMLDVDQGEFKYHPFVLLCFDWVIVTLREEEDLSSLARRLQCSTTKINLQPAKEKLLYTMFSVVIDNFTQTREKLNRQFLSLREGLFSDEAAFNWQLISRLQDNFQKISMQLELLVDHLEDWQELDVDQSVDFAQLNLTHIKTRFERFSMNFQLLENKVESLLSFYYAKQSNQTNNILRVLAVVSAVFLPLMFIASFFGMNFEFMPFLHSKSAFYWTFSGMLGITGLLYGFVKVKRWL